MALTDSNGGPASDNLQALQQGMHPVECELRGGVSSIEEQALAAKLLDCRTGTAARLLHRNWVFGRFGWAGQTSYSKWEG
jgi:hypothetical protein